MSDEQDTNSSPQPQQKKGSLTKSLAKYLPAIQKPAYKQSFNTRLTWTGIALALYLLLTNIQVIGIEPSRAAQLRFLETVLASRFGSIMTLGIGPIVTAGIILQLLVGSKIVGWDMKDPENRKKFQFWNKFLAIIFSFVEALAYILAGAVPVASNSFTLVIFVTLQLAAGGIIAILLDELVSKWGFGSGVSLFIAAGVASQIVVRIFSPLGANCTAFNWALCIPSEANPPAGLLWNSLSAAIGGQLINALISFIPIIGTGVIFLLVVYAQHIHVEVPLAFSALRGFGRNWNLKLLYTSNIPVILAAALLANVQLMGRVGVVASATGQSCGILGCFDTNGNAVSGVVYFLSANPQGVILPLIQGLFVPLDALRALSYVFFLTLLATIFSMFWVNTAGMDAKSIAEQLEGIGMQIPGYRRDPRIIESVLNRYIPALAVLGGITIGLLASFADLLGAVGTGTGILLTVMIIYNYYEELTNQNLEEAHPVVRKLLGG